VADLSPRGGKVRVGRLTLRAPNLDGKAVAVETQGRRASRSAKSSLPESELEAGLAAHEEVRTTDVIEVTSRQVRRPKTARRTRSVDDGAAMSLDVPPPPEGHEQAVLAIDERGIVSWSFAPEKQRGAKAGRARRDGQDRTFVIPRPEAPAPAPGQRGADDRLIGEAIVKQVLKVITFPIGKIAGKVAKTFVQGWERKNLQYGIRNYLVENYQAPAPYFDGAPARWAELARGRTLLMIHGTFSRAHGAFNELPIERMKNLEKLYNGRIIAFDHHTISHSPRENIEKLVSMTPPGTSVDVDIICHSRGGLVARSLAEWQGDFPGNRDIRVHRTALVGTTNNGTILADVKHWNELIDMLSTLINTVGVGIAAPIDLVLSFAQDIAEAGYPELKGLHAMVPDGRFLKEFNKGRPRQSKYLAIASNYEPTDDRIKSFVTDTVFDLIFERNDNDAMVRVDSICGNERKGQFPPVEEKLLLGASDGIEHSRYFGNAAVAERLETWLEAGLPVPA
jgi:pimeloyl-ACP methyl ester carboxylesterase